MASVAAVATLAPSRAREPGGRRRGPRSSTDAADGDAVPARGRRGHGLQRLGARGADRRRHAARAADPLRRLRAGRPRRAAAGRARRPRHGAAADGPAAGRSRSCCSSRCGSRASATARSERAALARRRADPVRALRAEKLALVLYAAHVFSRRPPERARDAQRRRSSACCSSAAPAACSSRSQPDLGTTLVIVFALVAVVLAAGVPDADARDRRAVVPRGVVGGFALAEPYAAARLTSFVDPWAHAHDERLPGGPEPDRGRLRRALRPRARAVAAEGLLAARGVDRLHPRRDRRGARLRRHRGAAVPLRADRRTPGCAPRAAPRAPTRC